MTIDSRVPEWLQERASFTSSGVTQGAQVGFNMGIQLRQQARIERAQKLQEEAMRLAMEEKERIAEGTVAVTRVLSEMGKTGGYNDPVLRSQFWDIVSKNPKFAGSPVFKDIMDTLQNAELAGQRADLLKQQFSLRGDEAYLKHLDRLGEMERKGEIQGDLLQDKSDFNLLMEDFRQQHRQDNIRLQSDENMRRDAAKPRTLRPDRFDLNESDRMGMAAELQSLQTWYRNQSFNKKNAPEIEQEYDRRFKEVEGKYSPRRKTTSETPTAPHPNAPSAAPGGMLAEKPTITTKEEFDKLPSGTEFIGSDGKPYRKP